VKETSGKSSGIEMTIGCWQFENGRGGCGNHAKKRWRKGGESQNGEGMNRFLKSFKVVLGLGEQLVLS